MLTCKSRHVLVRPSLDRGGGRTSAGKRRRTFLESRRRPEGLVRRRRGRQARESMGTEGDLVGALNQLLRRDQDDANSRKRPRKNHTFKKRKYKNNESKVQKASQEIGKEKSVIKMKRRRRPLADQAAVVGVIRTRSRKNGQRRKGPRLRLETTIQKPIFSHVFHEARNDNIIEVSYNNADMAESKVSIDDMANQNTEDKRIHEKDKPKGKIERKMLFLDAEAFVKDTSKTVDDPGKEGKLEDVAEVGQQKLSITITELKQVANLYDLKLTSVLVFSFSVKKLRIGQMGHLGMTEQRFKWFCQTAKGPTIPNLL